MCNLLFSLVFLLRIDHFPLQTCSGICREGDHLVVGPTDSGQFHKLTIGSIQRNRSACRVLRAGQAATLALGNFDRSLLRKVRSVWSSLILVPDHQVGLSVICTACFLEGHGDGESGDESHHLLEVWGRDCAALSCKDLSQGFPGYCAHRQRETNCHCGSCVWHGQYLMQATNASLWECSSASKTHILLIFFHRRSWGPGRKPWSYLSSSSTLNTWRWGPKCSSDRA